MLAVLMVATLIFTVSIFPIVGVVVVGVIVVFQIGIMVVRVAVGRFDLPTVKRIAKNFNPIFSVHVATHNEPPAMVLRTLHALADQYWPANDYEVVVIDNNTADPALWRPVQALCGEFGSNFRFLHKMGVQGAKAGALNIALAHTRADASHIITVDADYVVDQDFLFHAAKALRRTGADYVQFPQAYAACTETAAGVDVELEEYFRNNARMADGCEAVLLTGTLCVISRLALEAVGGWSGQTTTEDAEMGVRLCRKGFNGRFIDRVVGRGYLPCSLRDLERQRHRWAGGNLQTLIAHAPAILFGRDGMSWRRRGAILSQLCAWLNFSLVSTLVLLTSLFTAQVGSILTVLAAISVLLSFADIITRLFWRGLRDRTRPAILVAAIANRLALAPVSALATAEVLAGRPLHFVVTDKSGSVPGWLHGLPLISLTLFTFALLALPAATQVGWLVTAAVIALMTPFPAACATARTLSRYRAILKLPFNGVSA